MEVTTLAESQPELTQPLTPEPAAPQISAEQAATMTTAELRTAWVGDGETPSQPQSTADAQPAYQVKSGADGRTEIHLETGEVYKGKNEAEAWGELAKSKVHQAKYIREMNEFRKTFDAWRTSDNVSPQTAPVPPQEVPTLTPEQQQAAEAEAQAAQLSAIRNWFSSEVVTPEMRRSLVAEAIGVPPEQLESVVGQIYQNNITFATNRALMDFYQATPEFMDTPENTAAMMEQLQGFEPGQIPTAQDLSRAWALALYSGKAKPAPQIQPQSRRTPPPVMPSPMAGPTMMSSEPTAAELRGMSKEQIKRLWEESQNGR